MRIPGALRVGTVAAAVGVVLSAPACRDRGTEIRDCFDFECLPPCFPPSLPLSQVEGAIRARSYARFSTLFDPGFLYVARMDSGVVETGLHEWLRVWRRVMLPRDALPGDSPVPPDIRAVSIDVSLTQQADFQERKDLYRDPIRNPNGLDPARWVAAEATFGVDLFMATAGQADYQVRGPVKIVILTDLLARDACGYHPVLVYRWEDDGMLRLFLRSWWLVGSASDPAGAELRIPRRSALSS